MKLSDIKDLLSVSIEKKFQPNEIIFQEGSVDSNFYFILEGDVEISKKTAAGNTKVIAELEKGEFLGEGILSGAQIKPASARAVSATTLLVIAEDKFKSISESDPSKMVQFLLMVLESTNERLANTNTKLLAIYEVNQIMSAYRDDPKALARHLIENICLFTDSDGGVFMVRNPFSNDYRQLYSSLESAELNGFESENWGQTKKLIWNEQSAVVLSLSGHGSMLLIKRRGEFEDDQIRILTLMAEQIGNTLKEAAAKASERAKKILHTKHFDL